MFKTLTLAAAMLVAAIIGGPAVALEVGERAGPFTANPGGMICDTVEQAELAIDGIGRDQMVVVAGCGILRGFPQVLIEAVKKHDSSRATYMILKVVFLAPSTIGVQYSWTTYSRIAPNTPA